VGGWYQGLALAGSGGVQEEACIPGMPGVTLRDNTERPEKIEVGGQMCWRGPVSADYRRRQADARSG